MNTIESTNKYTESISKSINNTLTNTKINAGEKFYEKNNIKGKSTVFISLEDALSNFSNMKFLREIGSLFSNILTIEDWLYFLKSESQLKGKKLLFACLSDVPYSVEDNIRIRMGKISF